VNGSGGEHVIKNNKSKKIRHICNVCSLLINNNTKEVYIMLKIINMIN